MEEKKNKKGIIIIIVILLVVAIVGGILVYINFNKSTGSEWGDTYYNYINEKIEEGKYNNAENEKLQFIQLEKDKTPSMVLNYESENKKIIEISVINAENVVKSKEYQVEENTELNVEMLYDIETKEYNWYEHEKREDGTEIFTEVTQSDIEKGTEPDDVEETGSNDIEGGTNPTNDKRHEFTKEDMTEKEVAEGEIPSIPKFDEEFVKPNVNKKEFEVDLKQEMEEKEFKEKITEAVEDYKPQDQTITDEVKENVENSLNELETKKEEIKKAEEEKAKKEAEEKAKAEEEARKKAEEEAAKGLKVGNYTLKYGIYKGTDGLYDEDTEKVVSWDVTIELKQDGTYTYTSSNQEMNPNSSGTYKVGKFMGEDAVLLNGEESGWLVEADNQLTVPAGSGATFTYQGN